MAELDVLSSASENLTPSLSPPSILSELAGLAQVPDASHLATAVITDKTQDPYVAVLDYISHSATAAAVSSHEKTVLSDFGTNTLYVSPLDAREPSDGLSDDEDDGTLPARIRHIFQRESLKNPKKATVADTPRCTFGFGCVAISWPPPPNLEAEHLFSKRVSSMQFEAVPISSSQENITQKSSTSNKCIPREVTVPNITTCNDGESSQLLYVAHYPVGPPVKTSQGPMPLHAITIASTASSHNVLRPFIRDVCAWKKAKDRHPYRTDGYPLYRAKQSFSGEVWWHDEGMRRSRPTSSLILAPGILADITSDVERFLSPEGASWYAKHGLPHRRAFLFEGPPGTGKTSTLRALVTKFHLSCCYLTVTDKNFSNQGLCDAMSKMPRNALLILEDVDALFDSKRRQARGGAAESLTFSGLLNALDGVASTDHVVTVMTTNHPERLDAALIRGGRVDRRFYFAYAGRAEVMAMFVRFYPDAATMQKETFGDIVMQRSENEARSMALLQQLFIMYREEDAEACLNGTHAFLEASYAAKHGSDKRCRIETWIEKCQEKIETSCVDRNEDSRDITKSELRIEPNHSSSSEIDTVTRNKSVTQQAGGSNNETTNESSPQVKISLIGSKTEIVLSKILEASKTS